jgi:glutaconate CoA-transferase subunit B
VILFRQEHDPKILVPRVDFVSAPGVSDANVYRPGGPYALVTGRCVFRFDKPRRRFALATIHPGHTVDEIRAQTGFDFDEPGEIATTPLPDPETLALLRGPVAEALAETYPDFAARVFGKTLTA